MDEEDMEEELDLESVIKELEGSINEEDEVDEEEEVKEELDSSDIGDEENEPSDDATIHLTLKTMTS